VRFSLRRATPGLIAAALALGACGGRPQPIAGPVDGRVIVSWLECEECQEGELAAVAALGDDAVPVLVATLRDGMSPATRERLRLQLEAAYRGRRAYGRLHPDAGPTLTREEYVDHHLANRDALYRVRSIRALARIGSRAARRALRDELDRTEHPGIAAEIRRALEAG
jgi:hypothetical protein